MAHNPFLAGNAPSANQFEVLSQLGTYPPVLTASTSNPALGADGFSEGAVHRNGHMIEVWGRIFISGTGFSVGTGTYEITVPYPGHAALSGILGSTTVGSGTSIGSGILRPSSSVSNFRTFQVYFASAAGARVRMLLDGAQSGAYQSTDTPTPGQGMRITFHCQYPADPAALP